MRGRRNNRGVALTTDSLNARLREVFWERVRLDSGCWLWSGGRDEFGYGSMTASIRTRLRKTTRAHRQSWAIFRGEVPAGMCVCHTCDNPACSNPAHLFLGSKADNSLDMVTKGRVRRGELSPIARLTEDSVRLIRSSNDSLRVMARRLGVSVSAVARARRGELWKHVTQHKQEV